MAGYEIAYTGALGENLKGAMVVYLAAGDNPITAEEWATYVPPTDYVLNTPRATWFNELVLLGSPYVPTGEITYITTSDGYTWESVAALQRSVYPYVEITLGGQTLTPEQIAYSITTPPPGVVLVDSNDKNHQNIYYGVNGANPDQAHTQYFIQDLWGNTYILKSVNAANDTPDRVAQTVADAVLPLGWTKLAPSEFNTDVIYGPSYSGENNSIAHANEFRDSADSAWMQVAWATNGMTLNAATAGDLPIWAGPLGGWLIGSYRNDVIYGAQGEDTIYAGSGDDVIDGGQGINHAEYAGSFLQYTVSMNQDGTVQVQDSVLFRDGTDLLVRVQRFDFEDKNVASDVAASQHAGAAYRLYSVLDRLPDQVGLGYWIHDLDAGASVNQVASSFLQSSEYQAIYGSNQSVADYVESLYQHILDRAPDTEGSNYWNNELNSGMLSRSDVLACFTESAENIENTAVSIGPFVEYQAWVA